MSHQWVKVTNPQGEGLWVNLEQAYGIMHDTRAKLTAIKFRQMTDLHVKETPQEILSTLNMMPQGNVRKR